LDPDGLCGDAALVDMDLGVAQLDSISFLKDGRGNHASSVKDVISSS